MLQKGVKFMARRTFTTTLDEELLKEFKEKCNNDGITYNDVLEEFMRLYLSGQIAFERRAVLNLK